MIVPPHPPTVYSGDGKRMTTSLGPYKVGVSLVATCVNNGGIPPPALSWWREQRMIDDKYEEVILELMMVLTNDNCIMYISISVSLYQVNGQTINILSVENISRADQGGLLECRATNNNFSTPASTRLRLLIACKFSPHHHISHDIIQNLRNTASFLCKMFQFNLIFNVDNSVIDGLRKFA